jgi:uncharacterized membrane protein
MNSPEGPPENRTDMMEDESGLSLGRLASFCDGVISVAITLLVLSIDLPDRTPSMNGEKFTTAFLALGPNFEAFLFSFLSIGNFWIGHHGMFHYLRRQNRFFIWQNLFFIMCIVLIPFSTKLMYGYEDQLLAVIAYAASMGFTCLMMALMWWYAAHDNRLVCRGFDHRTSRHAIYSYLLVAVMFLLSIGVAFFDLRAARSSWWLIFPAIALSHFFQRRAR